MERQDIAYIELRVKLYHEDGLQKVDSHPPNTF